MRKGRFILTGAPGAGKTAVLRQFEVDGFAVIEEAVQFHDRSAFCTEALATFLGHPPSDLLRTEIEALKRTGFYERRVFLVRLMGFVEPTAARRIGLEDARRFEEVHERVYRAHGFEPVPVEPGSVLDRVAAILRAL